MTETVQGHEAVGGATARGKPDPNVKLPPAVKAAADRAEALSKDIKDKRAVNEAAGVNNPIGATGVVQATVQPERPAGVVTANYDPANPNPPDPTLNAAASTDAKPRHVMNPPPAPQPPAPQSPDDWEHQFKSLKGRYEQEAVNNRRMAQQIVEMQRLMAGLSAPSPSAVSEAGAGSGVRFSSPIAGGGNVQRKLTPKEIAEYGDELLDVVGRRAQEVYEPVLNQLYGELQQVKRQVGGVQNSVVYDARVQMYKELTKEVPNWADVNESPEFANWLDQIDPISRQPRRTFLNAGHNSNQTGQVVDIFKGFLAHQAAVGPMAAGQQPGSAGGPVVSAPHASLSQFVAPGRAKSGQTDVPPEKPMFNAADITSFYRDKIAGRYAGREAEADAIERALFDAQKDGRIRR